ncbi:MAG: tyrosine-type recombinase/integrase [Ruminococcus sp.]|nr:tyrosine-type recombinase/integrase [Ruminococcus sp.]
MNMLKQFKAEQDAEAEQLGTKWDDHDKLFVKWNGEPMNPQTPYGWFKEFCKHNAFRFFDIHSLWHLHASLLIFEGVDVVAVSAAMGHSIVGTTLNLYSHMFQEARVRNCDAISNALSFNNEPAEEAQDSNENEESDDIEEIDDESEEETMSLSM